MSWASPLGADSVLRAQVRTAALMTSTGERRKVRPVAQSFQRPLCAIYPLHTALRPTENRSGPSYTVQCETGQVECLIYANPGKIVNRHQLPSTAHKMPDPFARTPPNSRATSFQTASHNVDKPSYNVPDHPSPMSSPRNRPTTRPTKACIYLGLSPSCLSHHRHQSKQRRRSIRGLR